MNIAINNQEQQRALLPPFSQPDAIKKARLAEDAWNTRTPEAIALAYTVDSQWRKEHDYRLIKELWAHTDNRIAVRFAYEWHDGNHNWFRSYGNENWQFNAMGLMEYRHASINDLAITEAERKFRWPLGRRPDEHPGLSELGL